MSYSNGRILLSSQREGQVSRFRAWVLFVIPLAAILVAEGRARAIETVYSAITAQNPNPTLVAILQLDTLSKFALSPNTKIVIPAESAALMGAVQAIQSVLAQVPPAE